MASKRKIAPLGLERRVRPRREDDWDPESLSQESSGDDVTEDEVRPVDGEGGEASDSEGDSGSELEPEQKDDQTPNIDISSVSFGALARAQESISAIEGQTDSVKAAGRQTSDDPRGPKGRQHGSRARGDHASSKRSSKHAPQEQTSKRAVSRRREILPDTRRQARDPRFESLSGGRMDEAKAKRAYAFLDEYRDSEMAELRVQAKKEKDPARKEELKRQLMSMESRRKARQKKDDEDNLLLDHRKKEKELVAQGKKPFYLKKSEQKKQLLTDRFASMSKGQVDKAIARKRKKVASKERQELDSMQRVGNRH